MPQNQAREPMEQASGKIIFVSGKGGVGKSLLGAALAFREAQGGRHALLVEIGDNSYYKDFFSLRKLGHEPVSLKLGFDVAMWSGETCLREYVLHYLKLQRLYHVFFENRVMRALMNVAPGLNEISILGKVTSGIRKVGPELKYDVIVVDGYATGHALSLLQAPRGLMDAFRIGPMAAQSREIDRIIRDSRLCEYVLVTLLEEMPVVETLEFRKKLHAELGVSARVICNKFIDGPISEEKLMALAEKDQGGIGEFARYLGSIASRQDHFMKVFLESGVEPLVSPLVFSNDAEELVRGVEEGLR